MSWKKDRDSLIAQTMAFVQSVTGRKDDTVPAQTQFASPSDELVVLDALETELVPSHKPAAPVVEPVRTPEPPPVPSSSLIRSQVQGSQLQGEMANEIRARVASFRAHQERFNREREEYFNQTLARLRDAAKDAPPPRINK
jgi:hypothetical protein